MQMIKQLIMLLSFLWKRTGCGHSPASPPHFINHVAQLWLRLKLEGCPLIAAYLTNRAGRRETHFEAVIPKLTAV